MGVSEGRAVSFESDGLQLEGLLHLPEKIPCPGVVVAHPHPQYGGDMHNNVVHALCRAASDAGAAALRFNFRGVGSSDGAYDNGDGERRDVLAALEYLRGLPEIDGTRLAASGYSFGAAVSLRAAPTEVCAMVAVSPPTMGGWLSVVTVHSPALFVAGDRDEHCDPEVLREIAAGIGAEVVVHEGVDHFWWGSDDRLIETVSAYLREHL